MRILEEIEVQVKKPNMKTLDVPPPTYASWKQLEDKRYYCSNCGYLKGYRNELHNFCECCGSMMIMCQE